MPLIKNVQAREMVNHAVVMNLGDVRAEAEAMLAAARTQAASIVAEARIEAARVAEGAAERGHAEGFARGEAEGLAAGTARGTAEGAAAAESALAERLTTLADGWTTALDQLIHAREALREEARRDLLRLALAIAERVLGHLPAHDPSIVVAQVEAAVAMLAGATRLVIRVHSEDVDAVRKHLAGVSTAVHRASDLDVVLETDDSLVRGGCVVSAGDGEVDSRLDIQISRIVKGVFPELLEAPPVAAPASAPGPVAPTTFEEEAATEGVRDDGSEDADDAAELEAIERDLEELRFDDLDAPTIGDETEVDDEEPSS